MGEIIRQPRIDVPEWIALRIKAFSHRAISKRYYSFKKFIGDNIVEFYYPKADIRGKEKIFTPFSTVLFVKLLVANSFLLKWKSFESNIIHYYRTNKHSIATVIPDCQMDDLFKSLLNVVIYVDDDDFKIGDRVFFTKGAMEGTGTFEVKGLKKDRNGDIEYTLQAIVNNKNKKIVGSFLDGVWRGKGDELKRC